MNPTPNRSHQATDPVIAALEEVRADLAARRAAGDIPQLPDGELERQFSAIVDVVDAGMADQPALDVAPLASYAVLETWRPPRVGLRARLSAPGVLVWSRVVGAITRRQVAPFTNYTTHLLAAVVARQQQTSRFLTRVHLDRLRGLEYRLAALEQQLVKDRDPAPDELATGPE